MMQSRNHLVFCLGAFLFLGTISGYTSETASNLVAGKIRSVQGTVLRQSKGSPEVALSEADTLTLGDTIYTGTNSSVIVGLPDGAEMLLRGDTRIRMLRMSGVELFSGEIVVTANDENASAHCSVTSALGRTDVSGRISEISLSRLANPDSARQCVRIAQGRALFVPFYPVPGKRPQNSTIEAGEELLTEAYFDDKRLTEFRQYEKNAMTAETLALFLARLK